MSSTLSSLLFSIYEERISSLMLYIYICTEQKNQFDREYFLERSGYKSIFIREINLRINV